MSKKAKRNKIEWIMCLCGEPIAGCINGLQDDDWNENKANYLRKGYTASITEDDTIQFGQCRCNEIMNWVKSNHPEVYYKKGAQLSLF